MYYDWEGNLRQSVAVGIGLLSGRSIYGDAKHYLSCPPSTLWVSRFFIELFNTRDINEAALFRGEGPHGYIRCKTFIGHLSRLG